MVGFERETFVLMLMSTLFYRSWLGRYTWHLYDLCGSVRKYLKIHHAPRPLTRTQIPQGVNRKEQTMKPKRKWKRTSTPQEVIDTAIERKDWFSAFTNAVAYFEFWGFWSLNSYCLRENIDVEQKLRRLPVSSLMLMLYLLKLIDLDTFSKMSAVIKERNRLVHRNIPEKIPIYDDMEKIARATRLLAYAKQCIKKVREGIGKA